MLHNSLGGFLFIPLIPTTILQAGVLFRKWGIAVGKKLEDILLQEKVQYENNKSALVFDEKSLEYMYQGAFVTVALLLFLVVKSSRRLPETSPNFLFQKTQNSKAGLSEIQEEIILFHTKIFSG